LGCFFLFSFSILLFSSSEEKGEEDDDVDDGDEECSGEEDDRADPKELAGDFVVFLSTASAFASVFEGVISTSTLLDDEFEFLARGEGTIDGPNMFSTSSDSFFVVCDVVAVAVVVSVVFEGEKSSESH